MRYAFLFAIGVVAAFAARDALIGTGAFSTYSAWLAIALIIILVEVVLRLRMGASLAPMRCPNCGTRQPLVRGPISFRPFDPRRLGLHQMRDRDRSLRQGDRGGPLIGARMHKRTVTDWLKALAAGATTIALAVLFLDAIGINEHALLNRIVPVILGVAVCQWFLRSSSEIPWGLKTCPRCGTPQSPWRRPTTMRQTFLGGYTCGTCRSQIDRFGDAE
ncbi:hypothetical protein [Pseudorhodoplanes sp.]|uniref:hypothetical protein n=1 Tax=Pseudorhodoplanes sp. TaxID=1934341 RepID=UPI003D0FC6D5